MNRFVLNRFVQSAVALAGAALWGVFEVIALARSRRALRLEREHR